jgi:hypothetical protein
MKKIIFSLCLFGLIGCSAPSLKPLPDINTVKINAKFIVNLPENHTTGNMWQLSNDYNNDKIDYMSSVWHGNEKGVNFNFETKQTGEAVLNFALIHYSKIV